jgi:hypothetical protein
MEIMNNVVFVFRELTLSRFSSNFSRVDEEVVCLERTEVEKFAAGRFKAQASESSLNSYRYEIVQMEIGCADGFYTKETYSIDGSLLAKEVYDQSGCHIVHSRCPSPASAQIGELVLLFKNFECGRSFFVDNQVAVVLRYVDENGADDFTIGYTDEAGYFSHLHGARHLIKAVWHSASLGKKEMALRDAYVAWNDPGGHSEALQKLLGSELPYFAL